MVGMRDFLGEYGMARLDEKSARRIAAGRLDAFRERVDAALLESHGTSDKPDVRARFIHKSLLRAFGEWFLAWGRVGRNLVFEVAQPGEESGWVDILAVHHNLRGGTTNMYVLAKLSAHATARLLERRRSVDIERVIGEELRGISLHSLLDARSDNRAGDIALATTNGEFRFKLDDEMLVAVTWIATKPD